MPKIDTSVGIMETPSSIGTTITRMLKATVEIEPWIRIPPKLYTSIIPHAKHHNNKPMLRISVRYPNDDDWLVIELSEDGVFAYELDDGVS
jgi:hypothetical protein